MSTSVDAASGQILSHDQFQTAIKAAQQRFSLVRKKHPGLKGYLVLSLAGGQTGVASSAKEILKECPALIVDDRAKASLIAFLKTPEPKDAGEAEKKRLTAEPQSGRPPPCRARSPPAADPGSARPGRTQARNAQ